MNQEWFEMRDLRRRELDKCVWIPLRASGDVEVEGRPGHVGYRSEFLVAASIAVPLHQKGAAEALSEIPLHSHKGSVEGETYVPADVFQHDGLDALELVLAQAGDAENPMEWHLHQDLVLALKLKREDDVWLARSEGYLEVARLERRDGLPILLKIRAMHLKDYLCARRMGLYVSTRRVRAECVADATHIRWASSPIEDNSEGSRWQGWLQEIHEGGMPFGSSLGILRIGRKNVDYGEDVPAISVDSHDIVVEERTRRAEGRKLVRIEGTLHRNEWISPAASSPRVRGDEVPSSVDFRTDAQGTSLAGADLRRTGGWLWFRPDVMSQLLAVRGATMGWYTRDTGYVRCSSASIAFGVNKLGLVNVYAKDMSDLPEWQQRRWVGSNVAPDGGVSEELLAAQAEGKPRGTVAPEASLQAAINRLNELSTRRLGFTLFREHSETTSLIARIHRFRATDRPGLLALAKDLSKLTAERIDAASLKKIVPPRQGENWGSLKFLEQVLALQIGDAEAAHTLMSPLFGINKLRNADAHLRNGDLINEFSLVGVQEGAPHVVQGEQLLCSCVRTLQVIASALEKFDDAKR